MNENCLRVSSGEAAALPAPGEHGQAVLGGPGWTLPVLTLVLRHGARAGSSRACLAAEPAAGHPPGC